MAGPAAMGSGGPGSVGGPKTAGDAAPRMLGRYHVLERLARDSHGVVHLARLEGPNGFQRWATVRRMHAHLTSDAALVEAFHEGARLAARIQHPNVITTFDVGEGDGPPWIALEYVHGETVTDLLGRTFSSGATVPWDVACRIVADAALGVDAIAEQRSADPRALELPLAPITPSRLVVTYDGKAKVSEGCLPMSPDVQVLPYLAPERCRGGEGDARSDVFGLGVILWEAVAGRRLFAGADDEDTIARIEAGAVPQLRTLVTCPTRLEEVVATALSRDPKDRFQTPRAFARALQTVIVSKGLVLADDDVAAYLLRVFPDRFEEKQSRLVAAANVTEVFRQDDVERALSLSRQKAAPAETPSSARLTEPSAVAAYPPKEKIWEDTTIPNDAPTVPRFQPDAAPPSSDPPSARNPWRLPPASGQPQPAMAPAGPAQPPVSVGSPQPPASLGPTRVMLGPTMDPIGGSRRIGWWLGLVVVALVVGAATAWFMTPRPAAEDTSASNASTTATAVAAAEGSATPPVVTDAPATTSSVSADTAMPPSPPPSATPAASPTPPPPASAPPATATAVLPTGSPVHRPRRPPGPRGPPADPAHTGLLTVICVPACDQVLDGTRSLGPSPIFKLSVAVGSHRLTLRTVDPPVEKAVEVTVTADDTTVVREPMGK